MLGIGALGRLLRRVCLGLVRRGGMRSGRLFVRLVRVWWWEAGAASEVGLGEVQPRRAQTRHVCWRGGRSRNPRRSARNGLGEVRFCRRRRRATRRGVAWSGETRRGEPKQGQRGGDLPQVAIKKRVHASCRDTRRGKSKPANSTHPRHTAVLFAPPVSPTPERSLTRPRRRRRDGDSEAARD